MIGERLCYSMIFLKSQRGKIQTEKNQLFSWLKKEGKTEASAPSDGWTVRPVSPSKYSSGFLISDIHENQTWLKKASFRFFHHVLASKDYGTIWFKPGCHCQVW